jgi:hypothetical protein
MRTPAEIIQDQLMSVEKLGMTIQEMFKAGRLTRMWIDPLTNEVHAA